MKKFVLSIAIGSAILAVASCKKEPVAPPASEAATADAASASPAPSGDPSSPATGGGDGQGDGIIKP